MAQWNRDYLPPFSSAAWMGWLMRWGQRRCWARCCGCTSRRGMRWKVGVLRLHVLSLPFSKFDNPFQGPKSVTVRTWHVVHFTNTKGDNSKWTNGAHQKHVKRTIGPGNLSESAMSQHESARCGHRLGGRLGIRGLRSWTQTWEQCSRPLHLEQVPGIESPVQLWPVSSSAVSIWEWDLGVVTLLPRSNAGCSADFGAMAAKSGYGLCTHGAWAWAEVEGFW